MKYLFPFFLSCCSNLGICHTESCSNKLFYLCVKCSGYYCAACAQGHKCAGKYLSRRPNFPVVFDDQTESISPLCVHHQTACREYCHHNVCSIDAFDFRNSRYREGVEGKLICIYCKHRDDKKHQQHHKSIDAFAREKRSELQESLDSFKTNYGQFILQHSKTVPELQLYRNLLERELIKRQTKIIADVIEKTEIEKTRILKIYDRYEQFYCLNVNCDANNRDVERLGTKIREKSALNIFAENSELQSQISLLESKLRTVNAQLGQMPSDHSCSEPLGKFEITMSIVQQFVPKLNIEFDASLDPNDFPTNYFEEVIDKLAVLKKQHNGLRIQMKKRNQEDTEDDENGKKKRRKILKRELNESPNEL